MMEPDSKLPLCPKCGSEMVGPVDEPPVCPKCGPRRRGFSIGMTFHPKLPKEPTEPPDAC